MWGQENRQGCPENGVCREAGGPGLSITPLSRHMVGVPEPAVLGRKWEETQGGRKQAGAQF